MPSIQTRQDRSVAGTFRLKRRYLVIAAAFVLAGGYIAYAKASSGSGEVRYVTAQAQKGMITSSVSGSGNMTVGDSANVSPSVSGTVTNLSIKAGDRVSKGQVLFTITNDQLDINVSKSYSSVLQAQQQLDSAISQETQAQADLDNANGAAGAPASANMNALTAKENSAQVSLNVAQSNYNIALTNYQNNPTSQNYTAYAQATTQLATAQAGIAQAQSDIVKAQQQNQASGESIDALSQKMTAAQASVTSAQQGVNVAQADYQNQQNLAGQRTVTAPIDGTITTLNISNGSTIGSSGSSGSSSTSSSTSGGGSSGSSGGSGASSSGGGSTGGSAAGGSSGTSSAGGSGSSSSSSSTSSGTSGTSSGSSSSAAMVIQNLDLLNATVTVSEVDVAKLSTAQKTTLTFDAVQDLTLTGKVQKIDPTGTVSSGVVNYNVTVTLDTSDTRVKPGMSVTAAITTQVKQDVVTVPNSAVKTQGNSSYVQLMVNGAPQQKNVVTGLANDTDTEVTSGLSEGDTVVTQTINPGAASTTPSPSSAGGLGGLGGGSRSGAGGFGGGGARPGG